MLVRHIKAMYGGVGTVDGDSNVALKDDEQTKQKKYQETKAARKHQKEVESHDDSDTVSDDDVLLKEKQKKCLATKAARKVVSNAQKQQKKVIVKFKGVAPKKRPLSQDDAVGVQRNSSCLSDVEALWMSIGDLKKPRKRSKVSKSDDPITVESPDFSQNELKDSEKQDAAINGESQDFTANKESHNKGLIPDICSQKPDDLSQESDEVSLKSDDDSQSADDLFYQPDDDFQPADDLFDQPDDDSQPADDSQPVDDVFDQPDDDSQPADDLFYQPDDDSQPAYDLFDQPDDISLARFPSQHPSIELSQDAEEEEELEDPSYNLERKRKGKQLKEGVLGVTEGVRRKEEAAAILPLRMIKAGQEINKRKTSKVAAPSSFSMFNPKKRLTTTCSPRKIWRLVQKLNESQKKAVEAIGFGGLLKMNFDALPKELVKQLVVNFCYATNIQKVGNDKYLVTRDDVYDVLCLPISNKEVEESSHAGKKEWDFDDNKIREEWMSQLGVNVSGEISCGALGHWMEQMAESEEEAGDQFKRYFVMFVVCNFLSPTARSKVDMKLVRVLQNVSEIKTYDWCGFVLKKLADAVRSFHTTIYSAVNGCLVVLLLCFLHRFPLRGEVTSSDIPLVGRWENKTLVETSAAMLAGFDHLIMTNKVFPLSFMGKQLSSLKAPRSLSISQAMVGNVGSSSRLVSFEIPEHLPTDEQIHGLSLDPLAEISARFRRNLEIVARTHVAELYKHMLSNYSSATQPEACAAASTATQMYFSDATNVKSFTDTYQNALNKYSQGSSMTYLRAPRRGPPPMFNHGLNDLKTNGEVGIMVAEQVERKAMARKKSVKLYGRK